MSVRYDRKRRRYIADYRDAGGSRRQPSFATRKAAVAHERKALGSNQRKGGEMLVKDYAPTYLARVRAGSRPNTIDRIESAVRVHVLPALGGLPLMDVTRGTVLNLLGSILDSGQGQGQALNVLGVVSGICQAAIDDERIPSNPCYRLGRRLLLSRAHRVRKGIKALDEYQAPAFIAGCLSARHGEILTLLLLTGLRSGEAAALQWDAVDLEAGRARVTRNYTNKHLGPPKTGERTIALSPAVVALLRVRRARALESGAVALGWIFPTRRGLPMRTQRIRDEMRRVMKALGLPEHLTPHCLRHSFAYLHLKVLRSDIRWVKEQLGHRSITVTYDLYGDWLPMADDGEPGRLDALLKAKSSTDAAAGQESPAKGPENYFRRKTSPADTSDVSDKKRRRFNGGGGRSA